MERRVYERRVGAHIAGARSGAHVERRVYERRVGAHIAGARSGATEQRRVYERRVVALAFGAGCCWCWLESVRRFEAGRRRVCCVHCLYSPY